MQDMERVTALFTQLADSNFDDGRTLAKLKARIPTEVCNYIAFAARDCKHYEEVVQIVGAQVMGPLTGLARWDKPQGISGHINEGNEAWTG